MTPNLSLTTPDRTPILQAQASALQSCVRSSEILRGHKTVEINHNGLTYKLQATRLGKLILTK